MQPQDKKENQTVKVNTRIPFIKILIAVTAMVVGVLAGVWYFQDIENVFAGIVASLGVGGSLLTIYIIFAQDSGGVIINTGKKYTGNENCIYIVAERNSELNLDVPYLIDFIYLEPDKIPTGARLHYLRNRKKRYYELMNLTEIDDEEKNKKQVLLRDSNALTPELFQIPATMQAYKESIEYLPPTTMQMVTPGFLLGAMIVIAILMVVTAG